MDNPKNTVDKTDSFIRQWERHFIDDELKLENIEADSFDDLYNMERRHQSKLLSFLVSRLRKTNGPKYPHTQL